MAGFGYHALRKASTLEPFVGQIQQFGFNFAPTNWALCNGATIAISQNQALFALLGTSFGGDGVQTFKLPDFQSRVAVGTGHGNGLSPYVVGQVGGAEQATLNQTQLPNHTHQAALSGGAGTVNVTGTFSALSGVAPGSIAQTPTANGFLTNTTDPGGGNPSIYAPAGTTGTAVNLAGISGTGAIAGLTGAVTVQPTGGSAPVPILPPLLAITTCIALFGVFPSRS